MSPSQAGSSHSLSWSIFSLARLGSWPFSFSSNFFFQLENQKIANFCHPDFFFLISPAFSLYFRFTLLQIVLFLAHLNSILIWFSWEETSNSSASSKIFWPCCLFFFFNKQYRWSISKGEPLPFQAIHIEMRSDK